MNYIFFFIWFATTFGASNQCSDISGKVTASNKLNFIVSIFVEVDYIFCEGTLIKKNIVLTAGHCAREKKEKYIVYFGSNNSLKKRGNFTEYKVLQMMIHEGYYLKQFTPINNIAMMKLNKDAENSTPIELVDFDYGNIEKPVTLIGWFDKSNSKNTYDLHQQNLNILNIYRCNILQKKYLKTLANDYNADLNYAIEHFGRYKNTTICTEGLGGSDFEPSRGYGGGPLVVTSNNISKLVGVLSSGFPSNFDIEVFKPVSIFTNLREYDSFIKKGLDM